MKPYVKRSLLMDRPQAQPGDVDRYQRLLSARFEEDPDFGPAHAPVAGLIDRSAQRKAELTELHEKLFGKPTDDARQLHETMEG